MNISDLIHLMEKTNKAGEPSTPATKDEAVEKDASMKATEAAAVSKIANQLIPGLNYGDLYGYRPIVAVYHDMVVKYEIAHAIAGLVAPNVYEVEKVLKNIDDLKKGGGEKPEDKPKAEAFIETIDLNVFDL